MIMSHRLTVRALSVGLICFLIAMAGFYLIFSWESWRHSQITVYYYDGIPNSDPFEGGDIFMAVTLAIVVELALLPVMAGSAAALALPARNMAKKDLSRYAGLAGAIPLALISFIFWAMFIASLIQTSKGGNGQLVLDQAWFYLLGMGVNVLIILAGAFVAAVSCQFLWTMCRKNLKTG